MLKYGLINILGLQSQSSLHTGYQKKITTGVLLFFLFFGLYLFLFYFIFFYILLYILLTYFARHCD